MRNKNSFRVARARKAVSRVLRPTEEDFQGFAEGMGFVFTATKCLINGHPEVPSPTPNRVQIANLPFGLFIAHSLATIEAKAAQELEGLYSRRARQAKAKAGKMLEISESMPYRVIGERDYIINSDG